MSITIGWNKLSELEALSVNREQNPPQDDRPAACLTV